MLANKQSNLIDGGVNRATNPAPSLAKVDLEPLFNRDSARSVPSVYLSELGQLVDLHHGQILHDVGQSINFVYVLLSGFVSITVPDGRSAPVEVLTLGSGDITGIPYALYGKKSAHRSTVLIAGKALRIASNDAKAAFSRNSSIRESLLETVGTQCLYSSHLTACNARHSVGQRVARWLLIASDQLKRWMLPVTHNVVAQAIGVRRAGVTNEINHLVEMGILEARRGLLSIKDRERLEQCSCGCYAAFRTSRELSPARPLG